jgi:(p)ppGpp synthase/HD superfamily hydrolase
METQQVEGDIVVTQALHSEYFTPRRKDTTGSRILWKLSCSASLFAICVLQAPWNTEAFSMGAAGNRYRILPTCRTNTRLFDTPPEQGGNTFPSLNVTVENSTTFTTRNGIRENGVSEKQAKNGVSEQTNGVSEKKNGAKEAQDRKEETKRRASLAAPEVNNFTSIMMKEMFLQKEERETVDQVYKDLRDMSSSDFEQVDRYWDKLLPVVSFLGTEKVTKIYDALRVAYRAHRGQMRKSGEPFIIHPVEVALLLAGLKMDGETVMAGLLHDTVEDTELTFELVEGMFGPVVRSIVEGETKVSKLPKLASSEIADEQAENLRQMFVAMTDDYRIIIVKLADRLHNMRTLRHMKPEKQIKISRETLDIFAPLAHRMGIWQFKSELEDTAFMYLYPQEYKRLNRRLRQHQKKFQDTLDKSQRLLKARLTTDPTLKEQAFDVQVSGRMKEIYSLWHKMETKDERDLDRIVDVVALRVIITPKTPPNDNENDTDRGVWLCYHILGLVQHLEHFQPFPTRVKDYISFPKPNGYQSLHTALILNGQKIEVQIRTSMMHQVAEYGMASHWAYTDGKRAGTEDVYNTPWLSSIKEWQNEKLNARDFVDSVRSELLGKRVFVFLRNGKILNLARGTTAVDAAFQIHTEVGLNMHGVEINGKPVSSLWSFAILGFKLSSPNMPLYQLPISYELQNGDVVSILTGEGKPSTDWMRYAKSRSTRSKLRAYFRGKQRDSLWEAGKILLMDYLLMHGPLIEKESYIEEQFSSPSSVEEVAAMLPGNTQYDDIDDLLITIGKQQDRFMLHSFASKFFKVPQRVLIDAEKNRKSSIPKNVIDAVHDNRRKANDAAAAAASGHSDDPEDTENMDSNWPKPTRPPIPIEKVIKSVVNGATEYADPEHVCDVCLPIYGDGIVGTRPKGLEDATPKVHRIECPHAQRAINRALAESKRPAADIFNIGLGQRIDSVTLRRSVKSRVKEPEIIETPVKLQWADFPIAGDQQFSFPCEVVVHAEDRRLLLADCSEVVSELSQIVKTGSQTTDEHATLVFLIQVPGLVDLQNLMDSLQQIRSVMSVERRVSISWLKHRSV